jgi:vacuolar-type H+-ATPase subunit E/Vma4
MQELIETLEREAEARSESILAEAREAAAALVVDAERQLEARIEARIEAGGRKWRRHATRRVAEARRAAEERVLGARAALLGTVFERAATRLAGVPGMPRYQAIAPRLLERALSFLPPTGVRVVCDPATAQAVSASGERPGARIEARPDTEPGLVAQSSDGSVTVDATLGAFLERLRPALAMEVAARVEGES